MPEKDRTFEAIKTFETIKMMVEGETPPEEKRMKHPRVEEISAKYSPSILGVLAEAIMLGLPAEIAMRATFDLALLTNEIEDLLIEEEAKNGN